ncbi:MAG: stage V sporulation protein AA [Coprococcus sp.]|nr:stage V sporulation protein AA [Coprococcus sp.]
MASGSNDILYIKGEKNTEVQNLNVTLGDILAMECSNQNVVNKVKALRILKIPEKGQHRFVLSILRIIECIHQEYPSLDIQNEGETDLIVTYEKPEKQNMLLHWMKVIVIAGITFLGAAFSIMSFNNDVSVTKMFGQIYELVMGYPSDGFTILELTYCVGLIMGILVFFNHFGRKRFSVDPTPMEVEMRLYENDIQSTLVEAYSRKEKEIDVGKANTSGNTGS